MQLTHTDPDVVSQPTLFVVFGATGDLSMTKLFPALYDLFKRGMLPDEFRVLGLSRRDWSNERFREYVASESAISSEAREREAFLKHVNFVQVDVTDPGCYDRLYEMADAYDEEVADCSNKLFYLSMSPTFYEEIVTKFANSKLMTLCNNQAGNDSWTRVLIEKPFGVDLQTSRQLDELFSDTFAEDQLFRIDHYLAKDELQNILALRLSNTIFQAIWDHSCIESVHVKMFEEEGVKDRGSFYDTIGAFRDVGQNHLLQMLAAVAMENPTDMSAAAIRGARARVFEELRSIKADEVADMTARGKYEGYQDTDGVEPDSTTETYFFVKTFIDNERWEEVPFYLESGKAMAENRVEIVITLTPSADIFSDVGTTAREQITFTMKPDVGLKLRLIAKEPGIDFSLEPRDVEFSFAHDTELPSAYERLFYNALVGDRTLFSTSREVEAMWLFVTPIIEAWQEGEAPLSYAVGENGPNHQLRKEIYE